jgi:phage shock protein C
MYCTKCGVELREDDRFCSRCGNRIASNTTNIETEIPRPLQLDKCNKKVAGVCAGFARYLGVDVVLMRVIWLGIALCTGVGFLAYLAAWIVIPSDARYASREVMAHGYPQTS